MNKVVALFAGAGGLDLGFQQAGFDIVWANEYDKEIWGTYEANHAAPLDRRSLVDVPSEDIPDCDGIIGGPPCQSWSEGGALRGIKDKRGQLFYEFVRVIRDKQPKFFLAENVSGMLASRHSSALKEIQRLFRESGYTLHFQLLNASDYGVPQDRKRVFFIGFREDLDISFEFPAPVTEKKTLKDTIWDLRKNAVSAKANNHSNFDKCKVPNHEYMNGGFSTIYLSRNRVRSWDEQSYTIQAGGRHAPIHPQAPKMVKIELDKQIFAPGKEKLYRRLSVREVARLQMFPDDFIFHYRNIAAGYKMIGNAVPTGLAKVIANQISRAVIPA